MTVNHNGINATRDGKAVWEPDADPATPQTARDAVIAYAATTRTVTADGLGPLLDAYRDAVLAAAPAVVSVPPPAPQAADRRARYAAAIAEGFAAFDADTTSDAYLDAELLDAVVTVADAEEAELLAAVPALAEDLRYVLGYTGPRHAHEQPGVWDTSGKPCGHCARLAVAQANLAAYDEAEQPGPHSCPNCEGVDPGSCLMNPGLRAAVSGPVAGEQQNETPEAEPGCAHCGKTIRLITGTLAEWWVHDPDGNTICVPELAASSPRATPKPNAGVRQDGAQHRG